MQELILLVRLKAKFSPNLYRKSILGNGYLLISEELGSCLLCFRFHLLLLFALIGFQLVLSFKHVRRLLHVYEYKTKQFHHHFTFLLFLSKTSGINKHIHLEYPKAKLLEC